MFARRASRAWNQGQRRPISHEIRRSLEPLESRALLSTQAVVTHALDAIRPARLGTHELAQNHVAAHGNRSVRTLDLPSFPPLLVNARFLGSTSMISYFYFTQHDGVPLAVTVGLFRSSDTHFDGSDVLVTSHTLAAGADAHTSDLFSLREPLQGDPNHPYLLVVIDPDHLVSFQYPEQFRVVSLALPAVALTGPTQPVQVMDNVTFGVTVSPTGLALSHVIEARYAGTTAWTQVTPIGTAATDRIPMRRAGNLEFRAYVDSGGARHYSPILSLTSQFPNYTTMLFNQDLGRMFLRFWNLTKTTALEHAFWIRLNTLTGQYGAKAVRGVPQHSEIIVGAPPADDLTNAIPFGAVYTVGLFHTHTPVTRRGYCRVVGPSQYDQQGDAKAMMPDIVYDYLGNKLHLTCGNDSRNAPFGPYLSGPNRRVIS